MSTPNGSLFRGLSVGLDVTARGVWQTLHVVATLAIPWGLAVWYFVSTQETISEEAHFVFAFHRVAAIAACILLISAALLRLARPAAAASVPFMLLWALALAAALYEVHEYSGSYRCDVELCMPDLGVFLTAVPFASLVTVGVGGSVAFNRARTRSEQHRR